MKKVILASGSPRRRELLSQIGIEFEVITSNADENIQENDSEKMVEKLSYIKARAVYDTLSEQKKEECIVIGADTIVCDNGMKLGKPVDEKDAFSMLKSLSGREHSVYTGVTVINGKEYISFSERTGVRFYELEDYEIESYIATKDPMDKAGAYGIQGAFAAYVEGIDGDYNNVVGLPVARLYHELKKKGWL